ncbi:hypothetical protein U1Q18_035088 [Sarracenia purpurea var. burkii]
MLQKALEHFRRAKADDGHSQTIRSSSRSELRILWGSDPGDVPKQERSAYGRGNTEPRMLMPKLLLRIHCLRWVFREMKVSDAYELLGEKLEEFMSNLYQYQYQKACAPNSISRPLGPRGEGFENSHNRSTGAAPTIGNHSSHKDIQYRQ